MVAVRILVTDVTAALGFYSGRLGFEVLEQWGDAFAMVERDGVTLWLSGPGTSAQRPFDDGTEPSPGGFNRIVVTVENLEAALSSLGVKPRSEPISGPGGRQAVVEDGVGNLVELFEPGKN
ncbi:MAG TPA: VOC family protein [Fimbriimonadaceae bacterium]|nr:VOC family protein [Fimbriimonadaceae bacterium]